MKVRDAMHKGVQWVAPETKVSELAKAMREHDIGALPVGEDDRLIGMVTDRDIVCRGFSNGSHADAVTARDVMSQGIVFCRDDEELDDAMHIMEH
jgi:CBS domain-containing protein